MATPVQALMTLADYEALPAENIEIDEGRMIELSSSKSRNKLVALRCQEALLDVSRAVGGWLVPPEMAYVIHDAPLVLRIPDISVLREERLLATPENEYVRGAPELAVEVISPSDLAWELERKTRQYFAAGAKLVWQIYPETRTVHVYRADGSAAVLDQQGALTAPELFGDWSAPVAALFER